MTKIIEKKSFLGDKIIIYFEKDDNEGKYSLIDGEWIWIKGEC